MFSHEFSEGETQPVLIEFGDPAVARGDKFVFLDKRRDGFIAIFDRAMGETEQIKKVAERIDKIRREPSLERVEKDLVILINGLALPQGERGGGSPNPYNAVLLFHKDKMIIVQSGPLEVWAHTRTGGLSELTQEGANSQITPLPAETDYLAATNTSRGFDPLKLRSIFQSGKKPHEMLTDMQGMSGKTRDVFTIIPVITPSSPTA